jgi:hypothetical protein
MHPEVFFPLFFILIINFYCYYFNYPTFLKTILYIFNNFYNLSNTNNLNDLNSNKNIEVMSDLENIKKVSDHVPIHSKPITDEDFGHYLAGLIDGDGNFSKYSAHISFYSLDASLAYYIKKRIGYGNVYKLKNKNAIILNITKREGLEVLLNLINGKLRTQFKYDAIYKYILNIYKIPLNLKSKFYLNTSSNTNNHWLAGFIDAYGNFQIKIINKIKSNNDNRIEIQLNLQLDQKEHLLLDLIKNKFGGFIGYRKIQNTYFYGSTSFGSAKKIINYLDQYHLLSSKHINYLKWRKAYIIIQTKKYLTLNGQDKILKLKNSMNNYSKKTYDLN